MTDPHKFYLRRRSYNQCHQDWLDAMAALSGKVDVSKDDMPDESEFSEPDNEDKIDDYRNVRGE